MFRIMEYTNQLNEVIDTQIKFIPTNSKYAKYAGIDANDFNYKMVDQFAETYKKC